MLALTFPALFWQTLFPFRSDSIHKFPVGLRQTNVPTRDGLKSLRAIWNRSRACRNSASFLGLFTSCWILCTVRWYEARWGDVAYTSFNFGRSSSITTMTPSTSFDTLCLEFQLSQSADAVRFNIDCAQLVHLRVQVRRICLRKFNA